MAAWPNYMLVPSTRFLVPLGKLDPRDAAPLTDAALTSYHAVKRSLHLLGPGSTAVVIGAGGLGQMAMQLLKALSGGNHHRRGHFVPTSSRPPRKWAPTKRCSRAIPPSSASRI